MLNGNEVMVMAKKVVENRYACVWLLQLGVIEKLEKMEGEQVQDYNLWDKRFLWEDCHGEQGWDNMSCEGHRSYMLEHFLWPRSSCVYMVQ